MSGASVRVPLTRLPPIRVAHGVASVRITVDVPMTQPPPLQPEPPEITPAPRWVKVIGLLAAILLAVVIVLHVTGNSLGGPGSHGMRHGGTQPGARQP